MQKTNSNPKIHKVIKMNVDVEEAMVTLVTKSDDTTAQHSMTLARAYEKGLIDYINMNRVII